MMRRRRALNFGSVRRPTLQRIAAVLDEELLVCFQRTVDGEVEQEFAAVA